MNCTKPSFIRAELEKRWQRGQLLAQTLADTGLFPLRLTLKPPTSAQLNAAFAAVHAWVESWQNADSRNFHIEWRVINHQQLGRNRLPAAVIFSTPGEVAAYLKKSKGLACFTELAQSLPDGFERLRGWLGKYPLRVQVKGIHYSGDIGATVSPLFSAQPFVVDGRGYATESSRPRGERSQPRQGRTRVAECRWGRAAGRTFGKGR